MPNWFICWSLWSTTSRRASCAMYRSTMTVVTQFNWHACTVISGGQTGADRAALDWALKNQIAHAGWCPKGRLASDGPLPDHYLLKETISAGYRQRTKLNVQDSDATIIFNVGPLDGGTLQTVRFCQTSKKPYRLIQLDQCEGVQAALQILDWLASVQVERLNVAGPREEKRPGIYARVFAVLNLCIS